MESSNGRWESLLAYCKLTELAGDPEVQALLPMMHSAAVWYLAAAGVVEPEEETEQELYHLLVNRLTLDAWDRRDITVTGTVLNENPVFRAMLNQLKVSQGLDSLF